MRSHRVVFLAFLMLVGCGGDGSPQNPVIPSSFGAPTNIRIVGDLNFTLVPQSSQLTAVATFSNGTSRSITTLAEWTSSNPAVMTVTAGLVRVVAFGDALITASYRGVSSAAFIASARPAAGLTALAITGPAEVAPQTTAQFTATGTFTDGTTRDLTSTASWNSSRPALLRHVGGGRFEGVAAGDATVSANALGRSGTRQTIIVPQGTFKLTGTVRDASGGVENVLVEVISGTGTGLSTRSGFNGTYALHGVAGPIVLQASAAGYTTQVVSATVNGHGVQDLAVATAETVTDVSGDWTLVVSTSSACSDTWPALARRREVPTTITQNGTQLTFRFPTHVFAEFPNRGRIAGTAFSLTLFYDDYYLDASILERISNTEWVGVNGVLTGTATPMTITGQFAGNLHYYQSATPTNFPSTPPRACSADPNFELRRR
jgi:Carboxypeptidase regulatory-like domain